MKRILHYLAAAYILFLFSINARAQAPDIIFPAPSYAYPTGTAITALTPINNGGAVPATTYGQVTTLLGTGGGLVNPQAITTDGAGNVYVADYGNNRIRKVTSAGVMTTLAGSGTAAETNGTGTGAAFNGPDGIAYDGAGNLYVADNAGNTIRKIVIATGVVTTFAGIANTAGSTDGTLAVAKFNGPAGIDIDAAGNMYIADQGNNTIRMISAGGTVSTLAGIVGTASALNGTGTAATFNQPNDLAVDGSGNLYIADYGNSLVRKIVISTQVVTTFAGSTLGFADGTGTAAKLNRLASVAVDGQGNVFVADLSNNRIRFITPAGVVTTIAGSGTGAETDGTGTAAAFSSPGGIESDGLGNLYVVDFQGGATGSVRKLVVTGHIIAPTTLPTGLTFTSSTGSITGTPTAVAAATDYTVTAYNASGSSSALVTITCVRTVDWKAGSNTTAWNTAGNWSSGAVPTATDAVRIGVVAYTNNREPAITAADVTVSSITFGSVHPAVTLTVTGRTLTINDNLTVNSSSTPTITGTGNIDIGPGAILRISTAATAGVLTTTLAGKLTLKSDATGSASVSQITTSSIAGSRANAIYVERYVTGGSNVYRGYRLMSSPVYQATVGANKVYNLDYILASALITGAAGGGFDKTGNPTLYLFREDQAVSNTGFTTGNYWGVSKMNNVPTYNLYLNSGTTNYNLSQGGGFLFFFRGDRTTNLAAKYTTTTSAESVTFTTSGTLNSGPITVNNWYTANLGYSVVSTGATNAAVRGYNLVGNPYPSSIDWDTFQTTTAGTGIYGVNLNSYMYVLNPVNKNYGSYDQSTGTGNNGASNIIASGQGFFVVAKSTTPAPKLIFSESAKTTAQTIAPNLWLGTPVVNASKQFFHLQVAKDTVMADELLIGFNNNLTDRKFAENYDVPYKPGYGDVSMTSKSSDNIDLALNYIPLPKHTESISLNVNAKVDGIYKLSLKDIIGIPQLFDIWLMDAYKKDSLDMRQNKTYSFNIYKADSASFGDKRFTLVIRQNAAYAYRLLDFTAKKVEGAKQVQVVWKSENEQNYTNFTVERSIDNGKTFDVLAGEKAAGQGTYSILDKKPAIGQNLYRLKQEDINNTISYSKVVGVSYADLSNQNIAGNLSIYPNPVMNNVSLAISEKLATAASYKIRFMNSSGILVKQVSSPQPSWQGSIGNLQPGIYFIRVFNEKNDAFIGETKFVKL